MRICTTHFVCLWSHANIDGTFRHITTAVFFIKQNKTKQNHLHDVITASAGFNPVLNDIHVYPCWLGFDINTTTSPNRIGRSSYTLVLSFFGYRFFTIKSTHEARAVKLCNYFNRTSCLRKNKPCTCRF